MMKPAKTLFPVLLILFSLACNSGISLPFIAAATATPVPVIDFAVTIIYPTPTPAPVVLEPTPVVTTAITSTTSLSNTDNAIQTPALTSTVAIIATVPVEPADAFTPNSLPVATPAAILTEPVAAAPAVSQTLTATNTLTQTAPAAAPIILLEPFEAFNLQPGINELEFKWRWAEPKSCQPPDGFGYELRIWPAISGYGPMGVTDAVANQADFFCDPKSNVVSYRVNNLKGTPGVAAIGAGQFLWDIAYIQLEPYSVVQVSGPRLFAVP